MTDVGLVPYGRLADGSYGILLDGTDTPTVSVCEVLAALPLSADPANFQGRLVFSISASNIYVYSLSLGWISLLQSILVSVQAGNPPTSPTPAAGSLFYSTTTGILYLFDGTVWQGIGGNRGAGIVWAFYTGDGSTSQFDTTTTTFPPATYVDVYINGVVLLPGSVGFRDYYMIGNRVQLNSTPAGGAKIALRTTTFISALRNSTFLTNRYVADGTTNSFQCGTIQTDPGQVFVYMDGVLQYQDIGAGNGTYDYKFQSQNVTVTGLTSSGTTCTMVSSVAHGLVVGGSVTIAGALQTAYNGTFVITAVPNATTLQYVAGTIPSSTPATANPTITFGPVTLSDVIVFYNASGVPTPPGAGQVMHVRAVSNVATSALSGEINDGANLGAGAVVYAGKAGVHLQFKSLIPGSKINLTSTANDITINSSADTFTSYTSWNGAPTTYQALSTDRYIGSRNSSGIPVVVDIYSNIPASPANTGRIITVKDEASNAGTFQISVTAGPTGVIENQSPGAAYVMNTNAASVTMVFDGSAWHIISKT